MSEAVRLTGITKRFPGVVANRDVNVVIEAGTVHAIVGENGAGKSTLMKILYGMQRADEGEVAIDGRVVSFRSPTDAIAAGVGMVHQHFMLAEYLSVLENVILGSEPTHSGGRLDLKGATARIQELGAAYGLELDPEEIVEDLGVGARQRVEILKVLYRGARILILDEPTAVLVPQEVEELFTNLRRLRNEGVTIIFISHKLDEVLAISDAITVMRDGTTVATVKPSEVDAKRLGELMVGSELPTPETRTSTVTETVELKLEHITAVSEHGRPVVSDVSLTIHRGEVLGIAGVEGNGQLELVEAILGIRPSTGTINLGGRDIEELSTRERREAGIGYIPFDRHREGLLLSQPLWENVILGHQAGTRYRRGPWMLPKAARAATNRVIEEFDVRTPSAEAPAFALSGGNQQKLIVGREMTSGPSLLIAAHPTRGIDVGAQAAIWDLLRQARADGLAVLLISADLEELIGLSDSLIVMFRGEIVARLDPATATPEQLGLYMAGGRQGEAAA